jgi:hypothetical protein
VRPCGLLLGGRTVARCRGPAACSWALGGRTGTGGAVVAAGAAVRPCAGALAAASP